MHVTDDVQTKKNSPLVSCVCSWLRDMFVGHAIAATVKLRESDFRPTIALNRNLTIAASGDTPASSEPTLDFDHGINFIVVSRDANAGLDR
jgi:hypothetical protein